MNYKILTVLLFLSSLLLPHAQSDVGAETELIEKCAYDYMEGALSGDAERVASALHPDMFKIAPFTYEPTGKTILSRATLSWLIEHTKIGTMNVGPEKRNIQFTLLDINRKLASAKITSSTYNDYLLLAKIDEQWKIINVLWLPNNEENAEINLLESEKAGIEKAARDYAEGYFTGNRERMTRAIHPELYKSYISQVPGSGREVVNNMGSSLLIEAAAGGRGKLEEDKWNISFEVLDVFENIASAKIFTSVFEDYLHLIKIDGEWKIINVLWQFNPSYSTKK